MPKIKIETTQNVTFEYETAGVGDRIVAWLLDSLIRFIYGLIITLAFGSVSLFSGANVGSTIVYLILLTPAIFYYPAMEYFWGGYTVGKYVMKSCVLDLQGAKPSLSSVLLRYFLRTIDFNIFFILAAIFQVEWLLGLAMFGPIVAIIYVSVNKRGQRIGDAVAGTTVVKVKQQATLEDTIMRKTKEDYEPVYKNVLVLSDRDMRIIKEALEYYYKSGNSEHIKTLARKAKSILGIEEKVMPSKFLETIIKDYNALAMENEFS